MQRLHRICPNCRITVVGIGTVLLPTVGGLAKLRHHW